MLLTCAHDVNNNISNMHTHSPSVVDVLRPSPADKEFFKALDRNSDGKVGVDDLKDFLQQRNLPDGYAHQFVNRARGMRWWSPEIT